MEKDLYDGFEEWLDKVIAGGLPKEGAAVNFNIYEEGDGTWSLQIIVAGSYDKLDEDWACDEIFSSEEDVFEFAMESEWEEVQAACVDLIAEYLEEGQYAKDLKAYTAVCTGFIDGNLLLVYSSDEGED